ncbi:MAG: rod shape-determining protein MreD [Chloroflexi bacterium]|nr:rod shape-determining protein MreD [Chloroflexota bacterium]
MNPYAVASVCALAGLLQSTVTSHVRLLGASPDLVLMLAVACVLRLGLRDSLPVVLAGGLIVDILTGAPFGCAIASLVVVSVLVSLVNVNIPHTVRVWPYLAIAVASLLYGLLWMVILSLSGRTVPWGAMLVREVLPAVLMNTLAMPLMLLIASIWWRRTPEDAVA